MSQATQPFFIVSSGRSGTQMMEKLLGMYPQVDMHHEYVCTHVQPLAVRYYMGLVSLDEVCDTLAGLHGAAVFYSERELWGDSSNKLSWLIEGLDRVFPTAKFIYLVRDGRKVTSSFFHKLGNECYDNRSTQILQAYIDDPVNCPTPPPEKKYWWNLPQPDTALAEAFRSYDQFQRMCFHWGEINRWIQAKLAAINPEQQRTYKLEELARDRDQLHDLLAFLGLPIDEAICSMMDCPHNVGIPIDYPLTSQQRSQLMNIAGDVMRTFGYDRTEEYRMTYEATFDVETCGVRI